MHLDIPSADNNLWFKKIQARLKGQAPICGPKRNHPQQRPMRVWLLPAGLSSHVSQHDADRLGEMASFLPRTVFYEESVLLKYFPLDASCVSRTWYCQLELMTVETNTSKCCCDMAFGSGGSQCGGGSAGRDAGKHPVVPETSLA